MELRHILKLTFYDKNGGEYMLKKLFGTAFYTIITIIGLILMTVTVRYIVENLFALVALFLLAVIVLFGYVINEQYPIFKRKG